jgi:hypothetical protein
MLPTKGGRMDDETKALIAKLEARIEELELNGEFRWKQVKDNFTLAHERIETQRELSLKIETLLDKRIGWLEASRDKTDKFSKYLAAEIAKSCDDLVYIDTQIERLDQVYYHVFPDRLVQDALVRRQISKLDSKTVPDDKSQKT